MDCSFLSWHVVFQDIFSLDYQQLQSIYILISIIFIQSEIIYVPFPSHCCPCSQQLECLPTCVFVSILGLVPFKTFYPITPEPECCGRGQTGGTYVKLLSELITNDFTKWKWATCNKIVLWKDSAQKRTTWRKFHNWAQTLSDDRHLLQNAKHNDD